jgi:kumamolisin
VTSGGNGAWHAGPGWDPVTGWGSPDAYQLVSALAAAGR